jgi:hypothetical protein
VILRAGIAGGALLVATVAQAQLQPELRADVIGPRPYTVQPGGGITVALGYYARVSASIGYALRNDTTLIDGRWRGDLLGRFILDPFRQQRWGFAVGAGLSFRQRPYLTVIAEVEGPELGRWLPAIQVGAGGGFRAGAVLRRAVKGRR